MHLLIVVFTGIILVFIVRRELKVFYQRENRARIEFGRTPFAVLALIVKLSAGVGYGVVRVYRQRSLER